MSSSSPSYAFLQYCGGACKANPEQYAQKQSEYENGLIQKDELKDSVLLDFDYCLGYFSFISCVYDDDAKELIFWQNKELDETTQKLLQFMDIKYSVQKDLQIDQATKWMVEKHNTYVKGSNLLDLLGKLFSNKRSEDYFVVLSKTNEVSYAYQDLFAKQSLVNPTFKFARLNENAVVPTKNRISDVGYDLNCIALEKDIGLSQGLPPGIIMRYHTGIKIECPLWWKGVIEARSSLSKTGYMISNMRGTIDLGYHGELLVCLTKVVREAPDLVAPFCVTQLVFERMKHYDAEEVSPEYFIENKTSRQNGGFGSTDKNSIAVGIIEAEQN